MTSSAAWAPFLNAAELSMFLTLVEAEVRDLGVPYRLGEGIVEVDLEDGTQSLGLSNLAQVCAAQPAAGWPDAVRKHFQLVIGSTREEIELRSFAHDFERVRAMLRVRLYEACHPDQLMRPIGEGLAAGVVFDLASAMRNLTREEAAVWDRTDAEVFDCALANLALEEPDQARTIRGPEEVPIVVVEGTSYYTASRALLLEREVVPEGHPYGALVIVPSRHVFFYHLIEDSRVIVAVNALVSLAIEAYKRGPGSISDSVFWIRPDGLASNDSEKSESRFVPIPWELQNGTLYVTPPPQFVKDVLERVAQPPS
ncbi:MAG: hypothetical protein HOW73_40755 [Polyangiaceae bacterium]|nr:hypothetical protein [Polyangiaceae bacterium]